MKHILEDLNMACLLYNSIASMLKLWGVRIVLWLHRRVPCTQETGESVGEMSRERETKEGRNRSKCSTIWLIYVKSIVCLPFQLFCRF